MSGELRRQVIACTARYGEGGLGRFLATLVEDARREGELLAYFTNGAPAADPAARVVHMDGLLRWLFRTPPLRFHYGWRTFVASAIFDRRVATALPRADSLLGFAGQSLHCLRRARRLGYRELLLEAPTSHVSRVRRQHERASRAWPLERPWLSPEHVRRHLEEYDAADFILVTSEYARRSFLEAGVPEARLRRRQQPVSRRFVPGAAPVRRSGFTVVYVGRLEVTKGVPLLVEAFERLGDRQARLVLVGGWATAGMRRYLRGKMAADPRIEQRAGDPLPDLQAADVLVHPSFEDGLALAPLEALATGTPVIVSEDTGMKEFVVEAGNGFVVPTGDIDALVHRLQLVRARPLKGTFDPPAHVHATDQAT